MKYGLLTIFLAPLLCSCVAHRVDRMASRPALYLLDVAPGYRDSVNLAVEEDEELEFLARIYEPNPSRKWMPTISACLDDATGVSRYCLHLSYDVALARTYGRAKLISDQGAMVSNVTTPGTFSRHKKIRLKLVKKGRRVEAYVNGALLDERTLDYASENLSLGGSSGKLLIELISPPPPPAPE